MPNSAVHMIAHGRVQGVGFRFYVRERAVPFGLKGWVRNLPDGSVEIHAEGKKDILDLFIAEIRKGPTFGNVSDLDEEWTDPTNRYTGFSIEF